MDLPRSCTLPCSKLFHICLIILYLAEQTWGCVLCSLPLDGIWYRHYAVIVSCCTAGGSHRINLVAPCWRWDVVSTFLRSLSTLCLIWNKRTRKALSVFIYCNWILAGDSAIIINGIMAFHNYLNVLVISSSCLNVSTKDGDIYYIQDRLCHAWSDQMFYGKLALYS